jgi:hypothetical protein
MNLGGDNQGDTSWSTGDSMGAFGTPYNNSISSTYPAAWYMEDNTAIQDTTNTGSNPLACEWGVRCVIRFNTVSTVGSHGPETPNRSVRSMEVYANSFPATAGTPGALAVNIRGGTGMVFLNKITSSLYSIMNNWSYYRCNTGSGAGCSAQPPWGICDGTSSWDFIPSTGPYPCFDDIGRGAGVLINRSVAAWPSEVLDPIYSWLNNINGTIDQAIDANPTGSPAQFIANRDYYNGQTTGCSGTQTTGVCYGVFSARAAACTAGVAFWATDQGSWNAGSNPNYTGQGELYICGGGGWPGSANYIPYTYPHPLTAGGGGGGSPAVSLSPTSVAFGNVLVGSTSPSSTIKLTNTGTASLTISSIGLTGANTADFSQTNNCGSGVLAGGSCSIVVTCTPASAASFGANVSITDNAAGSPHTASLTCTGVTASAGISFVPTQISFGSQAVGTSSTATPITATNSGTGPLTISQVLVSGGNSTSFTQTNNCTLVLQPLDSCTVFVTFKPTIAGNLASCICFTDNAPGSPQMVNVTGTGTGTASIAFNPTSLNFGNEAVGSPSAALSVTVSNPGTSAVTLTSVTVTGTNAGDYAIFSNTCGATIAVAGSCVVQVKFTPGATGLRAANLTFTDSAPGSPQNVAVSGTGTQAGVGFSPTSLAFGNQIVSTTSAAMTTTLTNTGGAVLNIASITVTGTNASDFSISARTCGTTLAASGTCTVSATFNPAAVGARIANLSFADNAPGNPQTVPLTGTGITTVLSVAPSSLAFPATKVGQSSATQVVTLTNSGGTTITFTSIAVSGGNSADFSQVNTCGTTLNAAQTCTATVTFTPVAASARASALVFTDDAPTSPQSVTLSGTGTQSGAQVSPVSTPFGNQPVGTTSAASNVTLTNNGTATLNISGITLGGTNPSYFATNANTCGSTLAAGLSCTVSLTFTPQTAIAAAATLSFSNDGPGSPQVASLTGTGTSLSITFSPASVTFPNTMVGTTAPSQTITVANTGNGPITVSGITIAGANASDFTQTNNCGTSIAGGGSCAVVVKFTPSANGARVASVSFADNAPGSPQSVGLQGSGQTAAPVVCLSQTSLIFGNQAVGTQSNPLVTIVTNTGNANLSISGTSTAKILPVARTQTSATSSPIDTTGATLLVAVQSAGILAGPTDSKFNTWTRLTTQTIASGSVNIYYAFNPTVGSGHTFTNNSSTGQTMFVSAWSNTLTTSGVLEAQSGSSQPTPVASIQPGSITPSQTGDLFITGISANQNVTETISSPFTIQDTQYGYSNYAATAYSVAGASAQNPIWTPSSATEAATAMAAFKAAATAGGGTITGTNPGDFGFSTTCTSTLGPGQSCTYSFVFTPTAAGARAATFNLTTNAASSPDTVALTGTGIGSPSIAPGPAPQVFGDD